MAELADVIAVLKLVGAAYPNFKMDSQTPDAYLAFLGDLPADLLKAAVLRTCAESGRQFAPSVGEIRGAASQILRKTSGLPSALEAWDEVRTAPKSGEFRRMSEEYTEDGRAIIYVTPFKWSHSLVERVARQMGWPDFPNPENESTDRAHFFKHYEEAALAAMREDVELPAVAAYIEDKAGGEIKRLAEGKRI